MHLRDWSRKLGFGSYNRVQLRADCHQPRFGQFNWDLTAPTYLYPFARYGSGANPQPGFFVADVVLGLNLTAQHVHYFVNKATIMRQQLNTRPFLGLLVADYFSAEALQLGRKAGLIFATPDTLFGKGISEALRELIRTLKNAAAVAAKSPEVIETLFQKLSRIEGSALNLRGPLFEMILGHCFSKSGSIEIGVLANDPTTGGVADIDVLVKENTKVRACECKGYATNIVDIDVVKDWLEVRVPRMRRFLLNNTYYAKFPLQFEYWITSRFTRRAISYLKDQRQKTRKYEILWKDGIALRKYVGDLKNAYISKLLDEHYFKHPLSGLSRRQNRSPRPPKLAGTQSVGL